MVNKTKIKNEKRKLIKNLNLTTSSFILIISLILVVICGSLLISDNNSNSDIITFSTNEVSNPVLLGNPYDDWIGGNDVKDSRTLIDKLTGVFSEEQKKELLKSWGLAILVAVIIFGGIQLAFAMIVLGKRQSNEPVTFLQGIGSKAGKKLGRFIDSDASHKVFRFLGLFGTFVISPLCWSLVIIFALYYLSGVRFLSIIVTGIDKLLTGNWQSRSFWLVIFLSLRALITAGILKKLGLDKESREEAERKRLEQQAKDAAGGATIQIMTGEEARRLAEKFRQHGA
jgi:hypothetical protein